MVHFDLKDAHPEMVPIIKDRFGYLIDKYPFVRLNKVALYAPKSDKDHSMAYTTNKEIYLNGYWFVQPPDVLNEASHKDTIVPIGSRTIQWHGRMRQEPVHVLVHEFGHVMADSIGQAWEDWANAGWQESTNNPVHAVSGYALANPDEWSAELFAAVELGVALTSQVKSFEDVLGNR